MGVQGSRGCWETGEYNDTPGTNNGDITEAQETPQTYTPTKKRATYHIWIRWNTDTPGCEVEIPFTEETSVYQLKRKIAARSRRPVRAEVLKLSFPPEIGIRSEIDSNTKLVTNVLPGEALEQPDRFVILVQDPDYEDPAVLRSRLLERDRQKADIVRKRASEKAHRVEEEDEDVDDVDNIELEVAPRTNGERKSDGEEPSPKSPNPRVTSKSSSEDGDYRDEERANGEEGREVLPSDDEKGRSWEHKRSLEDREPTASAYASTTSASRQTASISAYRPDTNGTDATETKEVDEASESQSFTGSKDWLQNLKDKGFQVNKYTWNKGTKRKRVFFLDPGDDGQGGIDYSQAVIYWVKKKSSQNPLKDKKSHRMIYLKEITSITPGKTTPTFFEGDAKEAKEEKCLSIHFKALTKKPKPREKAEDSEDSVGRARGSDTTDMIEVPRTLDLEVVESEEMRNRIVKFLEAFSKKARKHAKRNKQQEGRTSTIAYDSGSESQGRDERREERLQRKESKREKRPKAQTPITRPQQPQQPLQPQQQQPQQPQQQASSSTGDSPKPKPQQPSEQRSPQQTNQSRTQPESQTSRSTSTSGKRNTDLTRKKIM